MIFDTPRYLVAGDEHLLVELGDEINMDLNFKALGLKSTLAEANIPGVIESVPSFATLLVHFDPQVITRARLIQHLDEALRSLPPIDQLELFSRVIEIPTYYDDPWSQECVDDYSAKFTPMPHNPTFVAEQNGIKSVQDLIRYHSSPQYWVATIGFWPGLPFTFSMDPGVFLTVPKYNPARTWTPQGTVGIGGACTAIYPVNTPGGYYLLGRTPVPIWDGEQRMPEFAKSSVLFVPGDRIKYVPIDRQEFDAIERMVQEGTYRINIITYEKFSVGAYRQFCATRQGKEVKA